MSAPPLLLHAFPSFAVGGAQVRFAAVANHFGRRFRHAIVAMDGDFSCRERLDTGLDVSFPTVEVRKGDTAGTVRGLRRVLVGMRPTRLMTSNWGTIEWAMANRVQLVPHVHVEDGFGPEERVRQLPRRVWTRRLMLAGRRVAVPSSTLRRIALEVWRLNPRLVVTVPNGIDLARFSGGRVAGGNGVVVGTIAALRAEKNIGRLLRAFALADPGGSARLLVVGDGPERGGLMALAQGLGVSGRVEWAGQVGDPAPLLRRMDVFAMSSDTEQMPLSLMEAMAAGLPVAATGVGDIAAMVPPAQSGFVVGVDDGALAGALRRLIGDAGLRAALGGANREQAEAAFDQARMFAAWEGLWAG